MGRASDPAARDLLEAFPAAVYTTDAQGIVTFFNSEAERLAGRTPRIGEDKWCITWRLYRPDGSPLPLDECPMAVTLKTGEPVRNVAVIAERPDGERVPLMPFPTPLFDADGALAGAVNLLVDLSDVKRAEASAAQRADEQAALYRFTDRLYRAGKRDDIYDAALDAILSALRCSRASILMFDDAGVMQFVASRGLSTVYREAVTGHTPWTPGEPQPEPITINDIQTGDVPDELKAAISEEGIRALAFIPIVAHGGVVGKFMAYFDQPHAFSDEERDLALTIARQIGFSIERARAASETKRAEEVSQKLRSIVENSGDAIVSKDLNGIIASWNKGAERLFGYTADEIVGKSVLTLIPPELQAEEPEILARIRRGERLEHYETVRRRKNGERIHISLTVSPVLDAQGRIVGASKIARDITERKRADEQRSLLINELNHRVKNSLAMVQSLAMQTLRNSEGGRTALRAFNARLLALSRAHDVLTSERWEGAGLYDVIDGALSPFRMSGQILIEGPDVRLTPRQTVTLSMVLHELATNAVKYGSLSTPAGRVQIGWRKENGVMDLEWREVGGPAVTPPSRNGFGTHLIERSLSHDLGGEARILYLVDGVVAHLSAPLEGQTEAAST